jgi:hypothetical protein
MTEWMNAIGLYQLRAVILPPACQTAPPAVFRFSALHVN